MDKITETLAARLREMVAVYWGKDGDGGEPPDCIVRSQAAIEAFDLEQNVQSEARKRGITPAVMRRRITEIENAAAEARRIERIHR